MYLYVVVLPPFVYIMFIFPAVCLIFPRKCVTGIYNVMYWLLSSSSPFQSHPGRQVLECQPHEGRVFVIFLHSCIPGSRCRKGLSGTTHSLLKFWKFLYLPFHFLLTNYVSHTSKIPLNQPIFIISSATTLISQSYDWYSRINFCCLSKHSSTANKRSFLKI